MDDELKWLLIIIAAWWLFTRSSQSKGFHNEQTITWTDRHGNEKWMRIERNVQPNQ